MSIEVPFYKPSLPPYYIVEPEFRDVYTSGMLAPSKYTDRLVEKVKDYLGVKGVVAFSSCSNAMMCLVGYIKARSPNKQYVIVPGFTFASTWQAVDWNGLMAIVVDTDEEGLISIASVEDAINEFSPDSIACIMAVHIFGNPAPIKKLEELSIKYNIPVCYDSAHGFGTTIGGAFLGDSGLAEVFSIGTTKPLSAGEGGILTTNDEELIDAMYRAAMHGHKYGELDVELKSLNGRIQEFNSIMAYHAFSILGKSMDKRTSAASVYDLYFGKTGINAEFKGSRISIRPAIKNRRGIFPSYKDYTIFIRLFEHTDLSGVRDSIIKELANLGVPCKRYYYPSIGNLHIFKSGQAEYKRPSNASSYEVCDELSDGCISIPFFTDITEKEQKFVLKQFDSILSNKRYL